MNIKLPTYASDLQLRFWRWMVNMSEIAMKHGPVVQSVLYVGLVLIAGLVAFTLGRLAGEFIASFLV